MSDMSVCFTFWGTYLLIGGNSQNKTFKINEPCLLEYFGKYRKEKSRKEEAIILLCKTSQASFQPQSHSDFWRWRGKEDLQWHFFNWLYNEEVFSHCGTFISCRPYSSKTTWNIYIYTWDRTFSFSTWNVFPESLYCLFLS